MSHWILRQGDDDLDALAYWDGADQPAPPVIRSAAELTNGLETTWRVMSESLHRWTVADLSAVIEWNYPSPPEDPPLRAGDEWRSFLAVW